MQLQKEQWLLDRLLWKRFSPVYISVQNRVHCNVFGTFRTFTYRKFLFQRFDWITVGRSLMKFSSNADVPCPKGIAHQPSNYWNSIQKLFFKYNSGYFFILLCATKEFSWDYFEDDYTSNCISNLLKVISSVKAWE